MRSLVRTLVAVAVTITIMSVISVFHNTFSVENFLIGDAQE